MQRICFLKILIDALRSVIDDSDDDSDGNNDGNDNDDDGGNGCFEHGRIRSTWWRRFALHGS